MEGDGVERYWLRVDGLRVHARRTAARPAPPPGGRLPLVLLHGPGVSGAYFEPLLREFAPDFVAHAPDLPGFGDSQDPPCPISLPGLADFVAGFLDALGLARAALVGNSFGCQIAVECAPRHPDRVARLVLQGSTMPPEARSVPAAARRWLRNARHEPRHTGFTLSEYRKAGLRDTLRAMRLALRDRPEDKLPRLRQPALVLRGTRDAIVDQGWAERVAALLPRGRLAAVPEAAHTMNQFWPTAFARAACPFLLKEDAPLPSQPPAGIRR